MQTAEPLSDFHTTIHAILAKLIAHCAEFSPEQLDQEHAGFGYPSIRLQLQHVIGAERYWVGVLHGQMLVNEKDEEAESIEALEAFRASVSAETSKYLAGADDTELNTAREMTMWGDRQAELIPARIIIRTQTHIFHHMGQITAMCRLLGRPIPPGLDYPVT